MSFPDDYKRVQMPGGAKAIVEATVYLARQLAVNINDWTLLVGDGATAGGYRVLMESNFNAFMQSNAPFGTKAYIEAGTDGLPTELTRVWKASELTATFAKLADTTTPSAWFIKDSAMPDNVRAYAKSLADANNALTNGWFRFDPATAVNLPAGIPSTGPWHMMMVVAHSSQNVVQVLWLRDGTGKIYTRSFTDGVWQAWIQATGITLSDLNTKVSKSGDTMTGALTLKAGTAASPALKQPDGVPPTTPADGDIWREDANGGLRIRKGATTRTILDSHNRACAILQDVKSAGTVGGAATTNAWSIRTLNTEAYDPESIVTLASNQFTLAYDCWCKAQAPFYLALAVSLRIWNVTDGVVALAGGNNHCGLEQSPVFPSQICAEVEGRLLAGKTYRVEYYCTASPSSNALGNPATTASGAANIFTQVFLERMPS